MMRPSHHEVIRIFRMCNERTQRYARTLKIQTIEIRTWRNQQLQKVTRNESHDNDDEKYYRTQTVQSSNNNSNTAPLAHR